MAAVVTGGRQRPFRFRLLRYVLDETEFLSPHGIRSLSQAHRNRPYVLRVGDMDHRVDYEPGESTTSLFGGNSNWRGPIWFPINYLLVEALERYHHFEEHLRERPGCLTYLKSDQATVKLGRAAFAGPDPPAPVPDELVQAILKARVTTR